MCYISFVTLGQRLHDIAQSKPMHSALSSALPFRDPNTMLDEFYHFPFCSMFCVKNTEKRLGTVETPLFVHCIHGLADSMMRFKRETITSHIVWRYIYTFIQQQNYEINLVASNARAYDVQHYSQ